MTSSLTCSDASAPEQLLSMPYCPFLSGTFQRRMVRILYANPLHQCNHANIPSMEGSSRGCLWLKEHFKLLRHRGDLPGPALAKLPGQFCMDSGCGIRFEMGFGLVVSIATELAPFPDLIWLPPYTIHHPVPSLPVYLSQQASAEPLLHAWM